MRAYRAGLAVAAAGLLILAGSAVVPALAPHGERVVLVGAVASAAHLHLYDKRIRWITAGAAWIGATLWALDLPLGEWGRHAGLGFLFVTFSALALKEQYCFRLPALTLVPALLALSLVPRVIGAPAAAAALVGVAGLIFAALAIAKARMPLHVDVGNKAAYQV